MTTRIATRTMAEAEALRSALQAQGHPAQFTHGRRKQIDTTATRADVEQLARELRLTPPSPWFPELGEDLTPVADAARRNLPPCRQCRSLRGDPCRTPSGSTRRPHTLRENDYRDANHRTEAP